MLDTLYASEVFKEEREDEVMLNEKNALVSDGIYLGNRFLRTFRTNMPDALGYSRTEKGEKGYQTPIITSLIRYKKVNVPKRRYSDSFLIPELRTRSRDRESRASPYEKTERSSFAERGHDRLFPCSIPILSLRKFDSYLINCSVKHLHGLSRDSYSAEHPLAYCIIHLTVQ
ncbi:hypothetical protein WN51_02948 [Melipona quadrifasciata]|uniref:Uncharacterized protein n=1 Tax=Melipona quadrifasciata TaxID=166423 RepID=A0A0N0U791_9HYME|nr:hypothetical protein WN51_02948 [Melipona quadrifasciata]